MAHVDCIDLPMRLVGEVLGDEMMLGHASKRETRMDHVQNATTAQFVSKLDRWADAFEKVLARWDEWLMEVHSLHLQGAFLQLAGRQSDGEKCYFRFP